MKKTQRNSAILFLALVSLSLITVLWGQWMHNRGLAVRYWEWTNLFLLLAGLPFILLQEKAGLPECWDNCVRNRARITIPVYTGILFGLLDVLVIRCVLHPEPYESLPAFLQPFPYSLSLYSSGAMEIEIFYRLIPLTVFMLAGRFFKKGRYLAWFFWTGAILTSLREPLEQMPGGAAWFITYSLLSGFAMNLLQAWHFRQSGFLASLFLRLGHYLIWHILLGIYVEFLE